MQTATIDLRAAGPAAKIMQAGYIRAHEEGRMVWLHEAESTWSYDSTAKADAAIARGDGERIESLEFIS